VAAETKTGRSSERPGQGAEFAKPCLARKGVAVAAKCLGGERMATPGVRAGLRLRSPSLCRATGVEEKSIKPALAHCVSDVELF
jgi:hypothetical protein